MLLPDLIKGLMAVLEEEMVEILPVPLVLGTLHPQHQVKEITAVAGQAMRLLIILAVVAAALVR